MCVGNKSKIKRGNPANIEQFKCTNEFNAIKKQNLQYNQGSSINKQLEYFTDEDLP